MREKAVEFSAFGFNHEGTRSMLYKANGYGATGMGLAIWESLG
jgi:hypothetical protein